MSHVSCTYFSVIGVIGFCDGEGLEKQQGMEDGKGRGAGGGGGVGIHGGIQQRLREAVQPAEPNCVLETRWNFGRALDFSAK